MIRLLTLVFLCLGGITYSQTQQDPVSWNAAFKSNSATEGEIIVTGIIQPGWHTYSIRATDAGPIPTSVTFTTSPGIKLNGTISEEGAQEEFDKAFDARLYVFHKKAELKQKITVPAQGGGQVQLTVEYMSCNDMMCLPPKTVTLQVKVQK